MAGIIEQLLKEHRQIETLLGVLEREFDIFARGERPDYELVQSAIEFFRGYPDACHHPKEDLMFEVLKEREPAAAVRVGDLAAEHRDEARRLDRVARAVERVLADDEVPRQAIDDIVRAFVANERRHIAMEEEVFFPAAAAALGPADWRRIEEGVEGRRRTPSVRILEGHFAEVRRRILQLGEEAEAARA